MIDVRYEEDKPSSHQHEPPAHVGLSGGSGTDVVFFVLKNMKKHLKKKTLLTKKVSFIFTIIDSLIFKFYNCNLKICDVAFIVSITFQYNP